MDLTLRNQERLRSLTDRYSAAGLPLTTQRRTLLEVLSVRDDHPTVDQIFTAVSASLPEVSRATVYRSLEALCELELIRRVEHPGSSVRFDPNMDPHHHFLCTDCQALSDLPLEAVIGFERLRLNGEARRADVHMTLYVRGTCEACVSVPLEA